MKILILMPMYKIMDVHCVISLVDFIQNLHEDGHQARIVFSHGFNAAKARNQLTEHAVHKEGFDYVLWLDTDHVYKAENLYKLVERMEKENLPMLSATYTLHGCPETAHGITEGNTFRHFTQEELKNGLIDCTVVGFGFLVMRCGFLKEMWDKFGTSLFVMDAKENCTEDVKFCRCAIENGTRVCFDSDVKVGHIELAVRY
jgi:hypothetical protein